MMKKTIAVISIITVLAVSASAQQPRKFKIDLYDAAMAAPMIADEFSLNCRGCIEGNPMPFKARIGIKAGVFGFTKFLEYKYPNNRMAFRVFKFAIAGLYSGVVVHNLRLKGK